MFESASASLSVMVSAKKEIERIRVFEPGTWTLYELVENEYVIVDSGEITLSEIPLVLIFIGERAGGRTESNRP